MKVKSESEVAQLCLTLCNPMDCSLPSMGFSRQEYWSGVPLPSPNLCIMYDLFIKWASPVAQLVKKPLTDTKDIRKVDSVTGSGRSPGEGKWQPTPVFLPGKFHGQRRWGGYSPWGHKESDITEHAHMRVFY